MQINTKYIETDPLLRGGQPCLRGHRIPVSQLLAELAGYANFDQSCFKMLADNYPTIDSSDEIAGMVEDLANYLHSEWYCSVPRKQEEGP